MARHIYRWVLDATARLSPSEEAALPVALQGELAAAKAQRQLGGATRQDSPFITFELCTRVSNPPSLV